MEAASKPRDLAGDKAQRIVDAMRASVARRNEEIGAEVAELTRRTREHVAEQLEAKQREGVLRLHDSPEAVTTVLFGLGDGIAMRMLIEPERDFSETLRAGIACARALL